MNFALALFLIGLTVLAHELGHFLAARLAGLPVKTFSVGFGPKILSRRIGGTEFRLSLLPLGGYVLPAVADEKEFFALPPAKRIVMALGGPLANAALALACFAALSAAYSGLTWSSIFIRPLTNTWHLTVHILALLPQMFFQPEQLSGIVGIVAQGGQYIGLGPLNWLGFVAVISVNLLILNLLPVPVLDGGKILLYLSEFLHPACLRLHYPLVILGWVFILGLTILTTVMDIRRYID